MTASQQSIAMEARSISSLEKIFPRGTLTAPPHKNGSALRGEVYAFQVAYRSVQAQRAFYVNVAVSSTVVDAAIIIRSVGLAPSELPCYGDADEHVLRTEPGLYPDPLYPLEPGNRLKVLPNQWRALWIEIPAEAGELAGLQDIQVSFLTEDGSTAAKALFTLERISAALPEQQLLHTEWFHADCISTQYNVEVFSERHWELMETYAGAAARHGMNMLLTPLFTPPLDTQVGGERPTVQLVGVRKLGLNYEFDFTRLSRWISMCERQGIRYLEFSHLFTQWGAKHAPKILVEEQEELVPLFGWHTNAAEAAYTQFLEQLLPALLAFIQENGLEGRCYFHVSDEPLEEHLNSYRLASELVRKHTKGFPVIDALSDFEFYEKGLVSQPIPSSDHIEPFIAAGIKDLWTYYCCAQYKEVANRFFHMPSARSRILGMQLYKFDIKGFLHWGYNFWYSQYSLRAVNPYQITDAEGAFPSGDAFLVYPGENGPIESIRLKVMLEAIQDLRALRMLEQLAGREAALELLEEGLSEPITFNAYPRQTQWLLGKREQINRAIQSYRI
ncbi:DUF4091 domain-containing protein [Paenibacillus algorifonticola]|uniref:DUF4091 domain-containing protein n=1 Tax=Paenibacillus algorifonticola TaxID=684063 RepID=UPI003D2CDC6C